MLEIFLRYIDTIHDLHYELGSRAAFAMFALNPLLRDEGNVLIGHRFRIGVGQPVLVVPINFGVVYLARFTTQHCCARLSLCQLLLPFVHAVVCVKSIAWAMIMTMNVCSQMWTVDSTRSSTLWSAPTQRRCTTRLSDSNTSSTRVTPSR